MLQQFGFWSNAFLHLLCGFGDTGPDCGILGVPLENMGSGSSVNVNYKYSLQKSENGEWFFEM